MKKRVKTVFVIFIAIIMLTSCNRNDIQDAEEEITVSEIVERIPKEIVDAGNLSGTLHVLAPRSVLISPWTGNVLSFIDVYVRFFTNLYPDVEIVFEYYAEDWRHNDAGNYPTMEQLTSLTTKLLADPPDLLIFDPSAIVFEKTNMEALFVDLYDFMYGSRGIERVDYFDNIFTAMERKGSLYHISPYVLFDMILLNRRLFDMIDVDADQINGITMSELLEYYQQIEAVYDESDIPLNFSPTFSFPDVLFNEALYDVEKNTVNVNTPSVKENLEIAMSIPMGDRPNFTPEAWTPGYWETVVGSNTEKLNPSGSLILPQIDNLMYLHIIYLQDHPQMQFANPIHLLNDNGDISFFAFNESFSIMRESQNQDLAWEFVRYIMEFEESMDWNLPTSDSKYVGYQGHRAFPVNRTKFENRVSRAASGYFDALENHEEISRFIENLSVRKAEQVPVAMDCFREAMEMLNHENRRNSGVIQSLIYPDLWLLYSGQQDIERTLANIQNRLEFYVAE